MAPVDSPAAPPDPGTPSPSSFEAAAATAWRIVAIVAAILLVGYLASRLRGVLAPLAIGLFLAALLRPGVRFLTARRFPRLLAVILPTFGAALIVGGALALVAVSISEEGETLTDAVQSGIETGRSVVEYVETHAGNGTLGRLKTALQSDAASIAPMIAQLASMIVSGIFVFLMACVYCFFFLLDLKSLAAGVEKRLSAERYAAITSVARKMWNRLERYVRGVTITATANSLMFGLALLLIGVPLILANMVLTFLGSFVPYAGPILATVVASALALGHGGITDALLVVGAGAVVQLIEGNVLQPFVVGQSVSISPFVTVLAITAFAAVAGILGAIIAVPATVAAMLLYDAWSSDRSDLVTSPS